MSDPTKDGTPVPAAVSTGTPAPVASGTVPPATTQPSVDEAKITELVKAQVTAAIAQMTESSKREIQSVKDKARAEVEAAARKAQIAEKTMEVTRKKLNEIDPDAVTAVELARYRAEEETRRQMESEEAVRRQQDDFNNQFQANLREVVVNMGVDPNDKRIDWATDASNYFEANKRVLLSAAKINKENSDAITKSVEAKIKEADIKLRKDLGIDTVDTTAGAGSVSGQVFTQDQLSDFNFWQSHKKEIEEAREKGLIR